MKRLFLISLLFLVGVGGYAQPTFKWAVQPAGEIYNRGKIIDKDGNFYGTGFFPIGAPFDDRDLWVVKYNPDGDTIWTHTYDVYNRWDQGVDIVVDDANNVYVRGFSKDTLNQNHWSIMKYDEAGNLLWIRSTDGDTCGAQQMLYDSNGYLVLGGIRTCRYDLDSAFLWKSYDAGDIRLDTAGNVYIFSIFIDSLSNRYWRIAKRDTAAVLQWEYLHGPVGNLEAFTDNSVDEQGNAYLTGWRFNMCGFDQDYVTIKVNANGVEQWVSCYDGPGGWVDKPYAIGVDESGNVYVTGEEYPFCCPSQDTAGNIGTVKYDSNGVEQWVRSYNGSADGDDHGWAIAFDDSGYVYVGGHSDETGTDNDYVIIKYDGAGNELWVETYSLNGGQILNYLALDKYANIYISGLSGGFSVPVVKYCQHQIQGGCLPLAINETKEDEQQLIIYPNPTTGIFTVQGARGEIQVYDLFGRLVLETPNKQVDMSSYPAGMYMVRAGEAVRKLILH